MSLESVLSLAGVPIARNKLPFKSSIIETVVLARFIFVLAASSK